MTTADTIRSAISGLHHAISRVDLLDTKGNLVQSLDNVFTGTITVDATNSFRRGFSFSMANDQDWDAFFQPGISEVQAWRGVEANGVDYWQSLGIFGISEETLTRIQQTRAFTAYDRARKISRSALTDYYTIPAGTNYGTAIQNLISHRVSGIVFNFTQTDKMTPALLIFQPQDDPWQKAQEMAASIGMNLFFDAYGACRMAPVPDANTDPVVAKFIEGDSANTMSDVDRVRSDVDVYNHIIVVGQPPGSSNPVSAYAIDDDPNSDTYVGSPVGSSPFGDIPMWINTPYVGTVAQAQAMADATLRLKTGTVVSLTLTAAVDPTLDVDQIIQVKSSSAGVDDTYVVETLSIPLDITVNMTATTRKKNVK